MYIWLITHIRNLLLKFVNLKSSINHELLIFYAILKDKTIHNNLKYNVTESFFEKYQRKKNLLLQNRPFGCFSIIKLFSLVFFKKALCYMKKIAIRNIFKKNWDINNKKNPEKLKFKDISLLIGSLL